MKTVPVESETFCHENSPRGSYAALKNQPVQEDKNTPKLTSSSDETDTRSPKNISKNKLCFFESSDDKNVKIEKVC